jgi:hypothetical protein
MMEDAIKLQSPVLRNKMQTQSIKQRRLSTSPKNISILPLQINYTNYDEHSRIQARLNTQRQKLQESAKLE